MTLANKLTIGRMFATPIIFILYYLRVPNAMLWIAIILILASITDAIDGHVARKSGTVTDFGKIMDPIADKILVLSAIVLLVDANLLHGVFALVFIGRDVLISGIRLVLLSRDGEVLAASWLGKCKTVFQDIAIVVLFFMQSLPFLKSFYIADALVWIAVIFTIWSAVDYIHGTNTLNTHKG